MELLRKIKKIREKDGRYEIEAYLFVLEALNYYGEKKKIPEGVHISGQELSHAVKDLAINSFGPMAKFTLNYWGIKETMDIGNIVYNMIDAGLMKKQESDSIMDFYNVYDFEEVFDEDKLGYEIG